MTYLALAPGLLGVQHNAVALVTIDNKYGTNGTARNTMPYDTDSFPIKVDNCCTRCITNDIKDFEGTTKRSDVTVQGIKGGYSNVRVGTIVWYIEDDEGRVHKVRVPNSLYVPSMPHRLLSPQHWGYETHDEHHIEGFCCDYAGIKQSRRAEFLRQWMT